MVFLPYGCQVPRLSRKDRSVWSLVASTDQQKRPQREATQPMPQDQQTFKGAMNCSKEMAESSQSVRKELRLVLTHHALSKQLGREDIGSNLR